MRSLAIAILGTAIVFCLAVPSGSFIRGSAPQPKIGGEFPDFTLADTDGNNVSLSDFRGQAIILSFMSCYTDTCLASVSVVKRLTGEFEGRGLVAPMVCSEIPEAFKKDKYADLQKRCGAGQVVLIDEDKGISSRYEIRKFPRTYLIGRDYTVRERIDGIPPLMRDEFAAKVKALVEEEVPQGASPPSE